MNCRTKHCRTSNLYPSTVHLIIMVKSKNFVVVDLTTIKTKEWLLAGEFGKLQKQNLANKQKCLVNLAKFYTCKTESLVSFARISVRGSQPFASLLPHLRDINCFMYHQIDLLYHTLNFESFIVFNCFYPK